MVGKPSETDSIRFKISSKTSRGKRDNTKDTIIDTTSDSQMISNFPYRWSPTSLIFKYYFYLFLYLYITRIIRHIRTPPPVIPLLATASKRDLNCFVLVTVKILKIGTPEIITITVLQLEQLDFTVQYCVQKMQTE